MNDAKMQFDAGNLSAAVEAAPGLVKIEPDRRDRAYLSVRAFVFFRRLGPG